MEAFVAFARGRSTQRRTHTEQGLFWGKQLKAAFLLLLSLLYSHNPVSQSYSLTHQIFASSVRTEPYCHNVSINGLREWKQLRPFAIASLSPLSPQ